MKILKFILMCQWVRIQFGKGIKEVKKKIYKGKKSSFNFFSTKNDQISDLIISSPGRMRLLSFISSSENIFYFISVQLFFRQKTHDTRQTVVFPQRSLLLYRLYGHGFEICLFFFLIIKWLLTACKIWCTTSFI